MSVQTSNNFTRVCECTAEEWCQDQLDFYVEKANYSRERAIETIIRDIDSDLHSGVLTESMRAEALEAVKAMLACNTVTGVVATRVDKPEIAFLESEVLSLSTEQDVNAIARVRSMTKFFAQRAREITQLCNKVLIERIEETGEDIVINDVVRLYVGNPPEYSVRNMIDALAAIFDAGGGDFAALAGCLSSGALKPGATKALFESAGKPKLFDQLFITTTEPVLKDGKPKKKLLETNAFTKRRRPLEQCKRIGIEDVELEMDAAVEQYEPGVGSAGE